jgi:putative transposase
MARSLRLEFSGGLYHVTSRGDRQENIYETDEDRHQFLTLLGDACSHHNWQCHAYCLQKLENRMGSGQRVCRPRRS